MVDDQLTAAIEELGERLLAFRPVEDVLLLHPHPGQLAALPAQLIAEPGEFLFLFQMPLPRGEPLISGHDFRALHGLGHDELLF